MQEVYCLHLPDVCPAYRLDRPWAGFVTLAGFTCFYCLPGESPATRFQCLASPRHDRKRPLLAQCDNAATGVDLVIMAAVQQMDKTAFELHKKNDKPAQQSITGSRAPGGVGTRETLSTGRFQRVGSTASSLDRMNGSL
jgi:hypothetical protein